METDMTQRYPGAAADANERSQLGRRSLRSQESGPSRADEAGSRLS
jgi:hypothetical protein